MGKEQVGKGVNIALGTMTNTGRIAQGGRNWEGFGADPFLVGVSAYETILGMQFAGVQLYAKHFINNKQEHDRTEHEIDAAPFLRSVAAVMCSYNLVNGTYACEINNTEWHLRASLTRTHLPCHLHIFTLIFTLSA